MRQDNAFTLELPDVYTLPIIICVGIMFVVQSVIVEAFMGVQFSIPAILFHDRDCSGTIKMSSTVHTLHELNVSAPQQ